MKALLLFLSFLLFASCSLGAKPVMDNDGDFLYTYEKYYIWPVVTSGPAGPLTLIGSRQQCPLDVVQELAADDEGVPFTFKQVIFRNEGIYEETDINIMFTGETYCNESMVWTVRSYESYDKYFVTTGGVEGDPGPNTARNWFKIVKYMDAYKLIHCPSVCIRCEAICRDVAIVVEDGTPYLGLSDLPVKVVFKLAKT